ncbi:FAD-dependent oxidoreductase [Agrobacterium vitis]|uniref:FAD-dependent oxidoreductase n=1 Tax=Agrobacterium vitis TaxID=373 RepID=A0A1S2E123_AGRVI|nr:FAD-dependent oxidoreductase [Agrobacterium vitis]MUO80903.1 FAD-dependent oxidoreductase [Agrobacterium vitis]MUO94811.1 FAD-dependent oxidoreductase [Agrobacterium vitis]MUP05427.1 FAD-dependent oxidoreductase [Agrobacterium vitis]MUZ81579.1 FAD-dependent oxidoreductase [Agrobacterium vitis]MVA56673.1 FAD-dependent oxidoreductase [Agrobacterium vitis]
MPALITRGAKNSVYIDGVAHRVDAGMSVAAVLSHLGQPGFSTDTKGHGRGLFCGMGICHECLVTVDGRTSQRSCMTPIRDGMRIVRQQPRPDIAETGLADLAPVATTLANLDVDLLIIGAGPGGLAAAETAAAAGVSVIIVDERHISGGQFYKQPSTVDATLALDGDRQARDGADLIDRLHALGVTILSSVTVWGASQAAEGHTVIACHGAKGAFYIKPRMLVFATGAFERPAPIDGWTLAGVMTTGAAQTLLRSYGTLPGRRILIAGNGPLNFQVAAEIHKAGGKIICVAERAAAPWSRQREAFALLRQSPALALKGLRDMTRLQRSGINIAWQTQVRSIEGDQCVASATVSGPDGERKIEIDTVLLGGDFTPSNELSRLLGCDHTVAADGSLIAICGEDGESSLAHVHIVGEAVRFGGAHMAMARGRLAGLSIAKKLGHAITTDREAHRRLVRATAFQSALWRLFSPDITAHPPSDDTLACRCESIAFGTLKGLAEQGPPDIATLKRVSRAGMGRCQGRYCNRTLTLLSGHPENHTQGYLAPQMPLRPVPLAALAVEKPEWGGHKRALLPHRPPLTHSEPLPVQQAATVIIGAGIVGLSTALFLAEAGEDVVVLERGFPGGLASGGNAGSLHGQLLSFDHGARAEGDGTPAARTLSLQRDSIQLWQSLSERLERDFEMKITGGLMVAETEAHMRFLEEKTRVERQSGIDCHVIGKDDLRRLEPLLSDAMIGAAYCPQEGKINPLVATRHVAEAALTAGARVFDRTDVLSIQHLDTGFLIKTSRGAIRARRIVNAAGAFAARIGAMLGLDVPVFGAPLQMVVTEAAAPAISHLIAHADRHLTLKQAANGNFLIGGGWTAGLDPVHSHPRPLFSSIEGNLWVAQHVVPSLRKLHVIRSWAAMNINIDGAPILGEHPAMSGFFNAVTSNGYTLGPSVGQLTAALIQGRDPGRDLSAYSISRFQGGRS